jgi:tricorn protease
MVAQHEVHTPATGRRCMLMRIGARRVELLPVVVAVALLCGLLLTQSSHAAERALMRFPTIHGDTIVFEAYGNLWRVARAGGVASRLTADPGYDVMPRFSPDGSHIAFTASYQGNQDVYVIPAGGGVAQRLTFHSDAVERAPTRWGPDNMVVTWTPDAKSVVFLSRRTAWNTWYGRLFAVPVAGGPATALPLDSGGLLTYSPDDTSIAYNRIFRNFRTWKRYDGGLAQKVYTYNFAAKKLEQITHWKGTDTAPMWYGRKIYFLSDRDKQRRENIWVYDLDTKGYREVTHFEDYDIDFPSLGNDGIVFAQGGSLFVVDLPTERVHKLDVVVPDDGTRTQPRFVDASQTIRAADTAGQTDYAISPNGKRALFSARGDVFSVPAQHGATRNLTATSNADEDHPSWSPDGRTVAYTTDVGGEQQIAIRPAEGGAEKILTHFASGFFYTPVWSPDAKRLTFSDANNRLWLLDIATGKTTVVAQNRYAEIHDERFAPDGRWLAYSITADNQQQHVWLYRIDQGKATAVSEPFANDFSPVFSPDGKYLYFLSTRHENPTFSESEFNVATLKTTGIYVTTLTKSDASPFAPQSDEGAYEAPKNPKAASWSPGASAPVAIDLDGLMSRAVPLPIPAADIATLDARDGKVLYETTPPQTIEGSLPGEKTVLHVFDVNERKDAVAIDDLDSYSLSADGSSVLFKKDSTYAIADLKMQPAKPEPLDLSHLRARIEPQREWAEMFENAWRLERDLFVNPAMNGVNWRGVHAAYQRFLPLLGSREDLNYLIGEMQGELSNSHTYVGGGEGVEPAATVPTGVLGVDFGADRASGRYFFEKIYRGDNTRPEYRSPLTEPGVEVHQGDYLLAVNGRELREPADPYSVFVGIADEPVTLTVADRPDGARREVTVRPLTTELKVREKAWIDEHRAMVDSLSGGKIAYIYLSDMDALGMEQFVRQFYPQLQKRALIVDDRWNGGGFIDQIVLERLRRILVGMGTNRERRAATIPGQLIDGPKVCLINHYSASDGDIFPWFFRQYGLGPLIGTRTWGGVRGIRGTWGLLDGGYITVPEDSLYDLKSHWVIENHGVDPDIEVETDPGQLLAGHDAQIETAVRYLMEKLKSRPAGLPPPPAQLPAYPPQGEVPPPSLQPGSL